MMTVLRPALVMFALLSALTGGLYPLLVTGIGQAVVEHQRLCMLAAAAEHRGAFACWRQAPGNPRVPVFAVLCSFAASLRMPAAGPPAAQSTCPAAPAGLGHVEHERGSADDAGAAIRPLAGAGGAAAAGALAALPHGAVQRQQQWQWQWGGQRSGPLLMTKVRNGVAVGVCAPLLHCSAGRQLHSGTSTVSAELQVMNIRMRQATRGLGVSQ